VLRDSYSGDVRTHFEAARRSVLSIQAGTATSTRRRGEPNAWNFITVQRDAVTIQVRAWDGRAFADTERSAFARRDGIWMREANAGF
jgi:hypothetical protein